VILMSPAVSLARQPDMVGDRLRCGRAERQNVSTDEKQSEK